MDHRYDDFADYYLRIFGHNPFEDMTEEEVEELLREMNGESKE